MARLPWRRSRVGSGLPRPRRGNHTEATCRRKTKKNSGEGRGKTRPGGNTAKRERRPATVGRRPTNPNHHAQNTTKEERVFFFVILVLVVVVGGYAASAGRRRFSVGLEVPPALLPAPPWDWPLMAAGGGLFAGPAAARPVMP